MFKNKKTMDPNMTDTLIGEGTHFDGKIKSEAGIRIEGHLTGDIQCRGDVTIGEKGVANSHIHARHVIVAGHVTGNITASGKLTIKASGQLHGNLSAHELSIEPGGVFQGVSKMESGKETTGKEENLPQSAKKEAEAVISDDPAGAVLKTW
jgi:cytoskeletal protein CcmA (bactofilin family)